MTMFVIAYDLVEAEAYNYEVLTGQLTIMRGDHIQESVWLVDWKGTKAELMLHLAPFFSIDDSVFVSEIAEWLYHRGKNDVAVTVDENSPVNVTASWGSRLIPVDQY